MLSGAAFSRKPHMEPKPCDNKAESTALDQGLEELTLGPDTDRVMAVLSLKLAQISPISRAKLTHCSRTTREVVLEACPLPLQSWVASQNRGILYEEPRAWQAHCYAVCWHVQGHEYMEPRAAGCPSVAPCARGDGAGLWPPYLERPDGDEGLHLRGGVLILAASDELDYKREYYEEQRALLPHERSGSRVSPVPTLAVTLHCPAFSEVYIRSEAAKAAWGRWEAYCEANDVPNIRGRCPQCPFLWLYPRAVLVKICSFAVEYGCMIDWVLAVVALARGEEFWERGDREPITWAWLENNVLVNDLKYDHAVRPDLVEQGYDKNYVMLDSVPEALRDFLRRKWKCKWAQAEYDDRMQFIKKQQEIFKFFS